MSTSSKAQLLNTTRLICIQHGFTPDDFCDLVNDTMPKPKGSTDMAGSPEEYSEPHLQAFLLRSLQWACPPNTPGMEARRANATKHWEVWFRILEGGE